MYANCNNRILLIDDSHSIHEDFQKILGSHRGRLDFGATDRALFDIPPPQVYEFELVSAYQGQEGLAMATAAADAGLPFAMAFVDMRMPPGWDGLETVKRLWELDPRLQVVICTAYSDHPWDEVLERLDVQDRLLILKKPFDMIEVSQLARTLTAKWSLALQAASQMGELKVTVDQLRATESDLRYTTKELQAFAYSVAHDLHSPLAVIGAFGGLLEAELADGDLNAKARHYLKRIQASAVAGKDLVTGLLSLTQIARAELRLERVDVAEMVHGMIAELQDKASVRSAEVIVEPGLKVSADARLIRIAIRNLVENAWKFSSRREQTRIEVGVWQETSEQSIFFVRDNGCGFDMAYADKLFQNFHRLHAQDEYPGTGVGLVTVSRVLVRHGGRVWADSVPGEGSTFYFSLPRAELAAATHSPAIQSAERE